MKMIKIFPFFLFLSMLSYSSAQSHKNLYHTGIGYYEKQDFDSSKYYFLSAINFEKNKNYYLYAGKTYYYLNEFDSAINILLSANELQLGIADYFLAKCYAKKENIDQTVQYMASHLSSPYKKKRSEILLDKDFNFLEYNKEWINLWKTSWYSEFEDLIEELNYLLTSRNYFDLLELAKKNELKYPNNSELYYMKALAYFHLKSYKTAISEYSRAIELDSKNDVYYFERSKLYRLVGKCKKAINDISIAIKINDEKLDYYFERASLYKEDDDLDNALKDIQHYQKYRYMYSKAHYLSGLIHFDNENYIQALTDFNKCIKMENDIKFFIARADTYYKTKTYKFAIKDYSTALDLKPNDPEILFKKAFVHLASNEKDKACLSWQKASDIGYKDAEQYLWQYCEE